MSNPKDVNKQAVVEKIEKPKEGGVLTYLKGHPKPYPGFPSKKTVKEMDYIKRMVPIALKSSRRLLERHLVNPKRYSHAVREIHRVFSIMIERDNRPNEKEKLTYLRDLICMILEFDNAYRFRFQDGFSELDLDKIKPDENDLYYMSLREDYDFAPQRRTKKD